MCSPPLLDRGGLQVDLVEIPFTSTRIVGLLFHYLIILFRDATSQDENNNVGTHNLILTDTKTRLLLFYY